MQVYVDWGDGTAKSFGARGSSFSHAYVTPGTWTITHRATDVRQQSSSRTCAGEATPSYFVLSGKVYKRDRVTPLASAIVTVRKLPAGTVVKTLSTNASGAFSTLAILKPGTYALVVGKSGYTFASPAATRTVGPSADVGNIYALSP